MTLEQLLKEKRDKILRIAAKHGARNVRVFGSVARGEADEQSDIDLVVEFESGGTLLDHAALWLELRELLGCKVEVVSDRGIKPRIGNMLATTPRWPSATLVVWPVAARPQSGVAVSPLTEAVN